MLAASDTPANRDACRAALIDLHGPGRVLFRNRRIVLDTFPQRIAHLCPLDATTDAHNAFETKVDWLVELMKSRPDEKILLITHLRETVEAIEEALRERISAQATVFHEGLSLLKRDKNAAWFADEEMGARIMLCSEIGSEGRNFQFAHHLVLFDLPGDPGLLEQRIGRLDRIGQNEDIHIHIPIIEGEPEEMLALWYHNGLGAFENTLHGSGPIYREFGEKIASLAEASADGRKEAMPLLLDETKEFKEKIDRELEEGRDHLLEVSSFDRDQGQALVSQIEDLDEDTRLEYLMLKLFDHFGVTVEDLDERSYVLLPEHLFSAEAFPGIPEDGISVTFSREVALTREDITFLSHDHPMVISAIDSFLSKDHGNSGFFRLEKAGEQLLMVETVSVLECIAPAHLHADRFLPARPIRQIIDQKGRDRTEDFTIERIRKDGRPGPSTFLREKSTALKGAVPPLLEVAENKGEDIADKYRAESIEKMSELYDGEIDRLVRLREMGHPVREEEIELAREEKEQLKKYLGDTPLKMDSVRLILAMT